MTKRSVKSRSEASRRSWRTRKKMKAARSAERTIMLDDPDAQWWQFDKPPDADVLTNADYRHALPNPWLDIK